MQAEEIRLQHHLIQDVGVIEMIFLSIKFIIDCMRKQYTLRRFNVFYFISFILVFFILAFN